MAKKETKQKINKDTEVVVTLPDKLELSMVQANELKHYELFQWLVILLAPIAVGFWTAYVVSEAREISFLWSAFVFSIITILFSGLAIYSRHKVFHGSVRRSIDLRDLKDKGSR